MRDATLAVLAAVAIGAQAPADQKPQPTSVAVSPAPATTVEAQGATRSEPAVEPAQEVERPVTENEHILLRGRNRSSMHPNAAHVVTGVEQDGNDMRARTPALQRGSVETARVDSDESYQRALAMVGNRAVFDRPAGRKSSEAEASAEDADAEEATEPAHAAAPGTQSSPRSNRAWTFGSLGALGLAVFGWLFVRNRS